MTVYNKQDIEFCDQIGCYNHKLDGLDHCELHSPEIASAYIDEIFELMQPPERATRGNLRKNRVSCWIYFIECGDGGPVKIGVTYEKDAKTRNY